MREERKEKPTGTKAEDGGADDRVEARVSGRGVGEENLLMDVQKHLCVTTCVAFLSFFLPQYHREGRQCMNAPTVNEKYIWLSSTAKKKGKKQEGKTEDTNGRQW